MLEGLFYSDDTANATPPSTAACHPAFIPELPLWRVQWAVLPGYIEVLHVHVS